MPGRAVGFSSVYNRNVTLSTENVFFFFFVNNPNCELLDLFGVLKRVLISL